MSHPNKPNEFFVLSLLILLFCVALGAGAGMVITKLGGH